jgi:hypothetical protein
VTAVVVMMNLNIKITSVELVILMIAGSVEVDGALAGPSERVTTRRSPRA